VTGTAEVRIGLLGPLLVDGRPWVVRSPAWRKILAALALNVGVVVSYETLIEAAGLAQTSKDPKKALQACVARLEARFGLRIGNQPGVGYWLDIDSDQVDVLCFVRLCTQSRRSAEAGQWRQVSETAGQALRMYRRRPFADIDSPFLETEWASYLEGLRLQALRDRIRADLHLGRHESVIPELEDLTRRHPEEEIFWALLMLAQYRAGSRPAAKRTYEAARGAIQRELDLDPGEVVEDVRTQIRSRIPAPDISVP